MVVGMWRLTRQEQWVLFVVLLIFLGGIAGRMWLKTHLDSRTLPGSTSLAAPIH